MRPSTWTLSWLAFLLSLFALTWVDAAFRSPVTAMAGAQALVRELHLTDLCLFTDARYTRHLSQADRYTPFQDHPAALEHFPSGSLLSPPYENLARPPPVSD
jgi:hypothetical protein